MNKVLATPKGMLLLVDQHMAVDDLNTIAKQLMDVTGMDWAVLPETELATSKELMAIHVELDETARQMTELRKRLKKLEDSVAK